jgi:hypothetical protein
MDELNDNDPMALIIPMGVYRRISELSDHLKIAPSEVVDLLVENAHSAADIAGWALFSLLLQNGNK